MIQFISKTIYIFLCLSLLGCTQKSNEHRDNNTIADSIESTSTYKDSNLSNTNKKYTLPEANEIKMIDHAVEKIENQLSMLNLEKRKSRNGSCELSTMMDNNETIVKKMMECYDKTWTFYMHVFPDGDSKILFATCSGINGTRSIALEQYSIGTLIEDEMTYALILDEEGNKLSASQLTDWTNAFEQAFIETI